MLMVYKILNSSVYNDTEKFIMIKSLSNTSK